MLVNKRRVLAQQAIQQGLLDPTDYQGAYQTYMDAYGNEELARKAQSAAADRFATLEIAKHEAKKK